MSKIQAILRNDTLLGCLGCVVILLLCLPYIILGENSYITIHDNLDGIIANLKLLKDNHALFDPNAVLPMMDGIGRSSFGNEWNLTLIPFAFLPCYWANVVNIILVKLTAFVGMFLLLRKFVATDLYSIVCIIISIAFACVPYYATCCGISAAGVPLVLYAFLNLRDQKRLILSYALVVYYALYSFLPFSGLFVCAYLFAYGIYLYFKEHTLKRHYWYAFVLLCVLYLLINYNILASLFADTDYITHRSEYNMCLLVSWKQEIEGWRQWVLRSQCHSGFFPVIPILGIYIVSLFIYRTKKMWIVGSTWFSVIFFVFVMKSMPYIFPTIQLFQSYQLDRFYFLYPCVCFVMLAISVENVSIHMVTYKKIVAIVLASVCLLYAAIVVVSDAEIRKNWKIFVTSNIVKEPTFRQFYAEDIFNTISDELHVGNRKSVKVASIAIYPAIAEYNGFYCADGYMSDYSLTYKHEFRQIIAKELDKSAELKKYFDLWGNRCYVFSFENQLNFRRNKYDEFTISSLGLNLTALSNMGCEYVISAVPILNVDELSCVGVYENETSYWKLHVYQVNTFAQ